jgi:hypothetical protein
MPYLVLKEVCKDMGFYVELLWTGILPGFCGLWRYYNSSPFQYRFSPKDRKGIVKIPLINSAGIPVA